MKGPDLRFGASDLYLTLDDVPGVKNNVEGSAWLSARNVGKADLLLCVAYATFPADGPETTAAIKIRGVDNIDRLIRHCEMVLAQHKRIMR